MRAVRSTINAAGLIKKEKPDMDESEIVLKAVVDINLPKFLKMDIPLFSNILIDLFPGCNKPQSNLGILKESIDKTILSLK
jgi:dynein heavy chain